MSGLNIFFDLDETLVSTVYNKPSKKRIKMPLYNNWSGKYDNYYSQLRPGALDFIEYCRRIGSIFILTAATKDYAQEHNKVFSLGFQDDNIFGRDYYSYYKSGMFCDRVIATKVDQYPDSILIDNQDINKSFGTNTLRVKMTFLGIKEDRLVKSREYKGGNCPPDFSKEIEQIENILANIKKLFI